MNQKDNDPKIEELEDVEAIDADKTSAEDASSKAVKANEIEECSASRDDTDAAEDADANKANPISSEAESQQKKPMPKPLKITLIVIGVLIGIVIIALISVNVFVRTTYATFYDQAEQEFSIPGIDSGFIPQDIDYYDVGETWLFSGYMTDGSRSPVYKRYVNGDTFEVYVNDADGKPYSGHGSAITSNDKFIYLTCENGYLVFDADDFISLPGGDSITTLQKVDLDFTPAFMNIENNELYVGNFYHPESYETPDEHHIATLDGREGGMNQAVMYIFGSNEWFQYGFSSTPVRAYSIPDRVQGVCATADEKLIFSTSYGLASSHILTYDTEGMESDGYFSTSSGDVPLFILDARTQVEDLEAPPMTEGIETHEGRIFICDESATNKYIFGKLYGAGKVFSIPIPEDNISMMGKPITQG